MSGEVKAKVVTHIGQAVFAIGLMALVLAVGLTFLKLSGRIDNFLESALSPEGMGAASRSLAPVLLWTATAFLAFALPAVMLNISGTWRRIVVWLATSFLTLSWGPVMVLAALRPEIGVPLTTVVWSGFCAMIYGANHILPIDLQAKPRNLKTNGTR